ncbi:MAG: class I SAM-dependent methyltransferase [Burkholderiales bacterium]|nr:class I SAM-dependent methyltransferase [Burkholderiales bacterium]
MTLEVGMMQCPCVSHRKKLVQAFEEGEIDFRVCTECGIAFRERFPSLSELEEIYRQAYVEEKIGSGNTNQESGGYAARSYAEFIRRSLWRTGARVLDYGAGSGALVERLRANGVEASGIEFSSDARRFCREKRGFSLMSNLDEVPNDHFDTVSMIEVVEHLTDLQGTLVQLHRVIAPDGSLLVTTPNRKGLRARIENGHWREAQKKFHLFLFDWPSLKFHLEAAGFHDLRRVVFSPVQRPGLKTLVAVRLMQALRVSGTLSVIAKRSK